MQNIASWSRFYLPSDKPLFYHSFAYYSFLGFRLSLWNKALGLGSQARIHTFRGLLSTIHQIRTLHLLLRHRSHLLRDARRRIAVTSFWCSFWTRRHRLGLHRLEGLWPGQSLWLLCAFVRGKWCSPWSGEGRKRMTWELEVSRFWGWLKAHKWIVRFHKSVWTVWGLWAKSSKTCRVSFALFLRSRKLVLSYRQSTLKMFGESLTCMILTLSQVLDLEGIWFASREDQWVQSSFQALPVWF